MNSDNPLRPRSSDSAQGVCTLYAQPSFPPFAAPQAIYLQHHIEPLWCASGGQWVKDRKQAVRFASNMDAIAYCVALSLAGRVIGFDAFGRELYRLETDHIVRAFAQPHIARSVSPLQSRKSERN